MLKELDDHSPADNQVSRVVDETDRPHAGRSTPSREGASRAMRPLSPAGTMPGSREQLVPRKGKRGSGLVADDNPVEVAAPATNTDTVGKDGSRVDHGSFVHQGSDVDPELIATIQEQWRRRRAWHRAEKSLTLQAKALCRRLAEGGDKKEADVIYNAALGKGEHPYGEVALGAILPLVEARNGLERQRKDVEKRLAKLAGQLPVAPFVLATRGVGIASLAAIVGEAGDLSNYSNPAKLWKRMGLAVMPDGRQRRIAGEAAIAHGYNAERRSVVWNIGACIVKAGGPLKQVYDERKAYELPRVESKAHAHNRAQRYAEKRFLKLLWSEWRRQAKSAVITIDAVPAAS